MRELAYQEARAEALAQLFETDERVMVIGRDLAAPFNPPTDLMKRFPDRFLAPPISELGYAGMGTGAAMVGFRPIVSFYTASFIFEAWPQVVNEAANVAYLSNGRVSAPVIFHVHHGLRGGGGAQHSHSPQAALWNVPGLKIMLPSSPYDVKGLLMEAVEEENPVIFIDHLLLGEVRGEVPEEPYRIPFGKAEVKREGSDLTLIATSYQVQQSLKAAEALAGDGISVEVVDPRTLAPFDEATLVASVRKTGRLLVVDECHMRCSVGSEIVASVVEQAWGDLKAAPRRVATDDVPVPYSEPLERAISPTIDKITAAAKSLLGG